MYFLWSLCSYLSIISASTCQNSHFLQKQILRNKHWKLESCVLNWLFLHSLLPTTASEFISTTFTEFMFHIPLLFIFLPSLFLFFLFFIGMLVISRKCAKGKQAHRKWTDLYEGGLRWIRQTHKYLKCVISGQCLMQMWDGADPC